MGIKTNLSRTPIIWVLLDNRPGNQTQCIGVAEALELEYITKKVRYSSFSLLPNAFLGANFLGVSKDTQKNLGEPWPDLLIAAGRRLSPIARAVKLRSQGHTKIVQIMYPGFSGIDDFDLIFMPTHDKFVQGSNIVRLVGAPHVITDHVLEKESNNWKKTVLTLPEPRIAVLIGGSTRRRKFTVEMGRKLGHVVNKMACEVGGSLLISTSRRTGHKVEGAFIAEITVPHNYFRWGQDSANPYLGYLGLADTIVVTGESVSMCSEACATRAPVFIYAPPDLITNKHARLHLQLYNDEHARPLTGQWSNWRCSRLNSAAYIADIIRKRLFT